MSSLDARRPGIGQARQLSCIRVVVLLVIADLWCLVSRLVSVYHRNHGCLELIEDGPGGTQWAFLHCPGGRASSMDGIKSK